MKKVSAKNLQVVSIDTYVGSNLVRVKNIINENRVISLFLSTLLSYLVYYRIMN